MAALPKKAEEHFNMAWVFDHSGDHAHKIGTHIKRSDLSYCGTSACAMGWAGTIPSFRRAGWLVNSNDYTEKLEEEFFDIENRDAQILFYDMSIKTPKQWARHCREFIKDNA